MDILRQKVLILQTMLHYRQISSNFTIKVCERIVLGSHIFMMAYFSKTKIYDAPISIFTCYALLVFIKSLTSLKLEPEI